MSVLTVLSEICGYIMFFAWGYSFYPQPWLNYKLKSVSGMSFDWLLMNFTAHCAYLCFNGALFLSPTLLRQYHESLGDAGSGAEPVHWTDFAFSVHAVTLTGLTVLQIPMYNSKTRPSSMSKFGRFALYAAWGCSILVFAVVLLGGAEWLDFLFYLGSVKLVVTIFKYVPQAVLNYQRKSTHGWAIGMVLSDGTGGVFSMVQMVLDSIEAGDWSVILGNWIKTGLGVLTIVFQALFIAQHYCLYPGQAPRNKKESATGLVDGMDDGSGGGQAMKEVRAGRAQNGGGRHKFVVLGDDSDDSEDEFANPFVSPVVSSRST